MKKSLFLATIIGLLPLTPSAWGGDLVWNDDKTVNWDNKNWIPTIWGDTSSLDVPEWVASSTPSDFAFNSDNKTENKLLIINGEHNLNNINMWNNVLRTITEANGSTYVGYNPEITATKDGAYTYGGLLIKSGSKVSISTPKTSSDPYSKHTSVGTLALENNAKLTITDRKLTVTGLPYTSLGSGAVIELSALSLEHKAGGVLSMGASDNKEWDAVVVSGANGGVGTITNNSKEAAVLGTDSAKHVEYSNVRINVQGDVEKTEIAAKLGNATIFNDTKGCEVVVSGGISEGASVAVSQVSTGIKIGDGKSSAYGNVTLLNRGTDKLKMDSIFLANGTTLDSRQGGSESTVSTIEMNAYDSDLNSRIDVVSNAGSYGLILQEEATLDANLILGTGNKEEAVVFGFWTLNQNEYMSKNSTGMSLNMDGNNVTLRKGITLMSWGIDVVPSAPSEILLFSMVDQLTLEGRGLFDGEYFTYEKGISAAEYFSTSLTGNPYHLALPEPDASGRGWYIEYRANADNRTGNVYLAYNMVPEPTTATLSLLALAGLAARRRRASR